MSTLQKIADLLRVKHVLDQLNVIDPTTLTSREREAVRERRARAYEQAQSLLLTGTSCRGLLLIKALEGQRHE